MPMLAEPPIPVTERGPEIVGSDGGKWYLPTEESKQIMAEAWNRVAKHYGIPLTVPCFRAYIAARIIVISAYKGVYMPDDVFEKTFQAYRRAMPDLVE